MTTMLLCDECPKTFLNKASLWKHRSYLKEKTFTCLVCLKNFTLRAEFVVENVVADENFTDDIKEETNIPNNNEENKFS